MTEPSSPLAQLEYLGDAARWVGDIQALIPACALLGTLAPGEVPALARYLAVYRCAPGETVVAAGRPGEYAVLVLQGRLRAATAEAGSAQADLEPGASAGELAMIDGAPHEAGCAALEPALVAVLARDSLARIVIEQPGLGAKILMGLVGILCGELRAARERRG